MANIFKELRRRNLFRVAGVYAVVGWLLVQMAIAFETSLSLPAWFDAAITATLLLGFPIAMIFAWAFEMTPEGVKLTAAVPEGTSIAAKTGRKLDYFIIGGLALVGIIIIGDRLMPEDPVVVDGASGSTAGDTNAAAASIAVLPFDDLSPEGDQEYFSDGIAEEILNVLVGVDGLSVASRTSSFQFKGRDLGIPAIAQELNVRHVVEGSVRKAGNTIRITAQLIDAEGDRHLWSDTFDRPLTAENIFEIQDDIATAIVAALSEALGMKNVADIEVVAPTENLTAYELYLEARPLYLARSNLDKVDELLARAVTQDPNFAKAWEIRAATNMLMPDYNYTDLSVEERFGRAIEYAERALTIDPDSATAIAVLADIRIGETEELRVRHDIGKIIKDFERALEIDPRNGSALNWLGLTYGLVGDLDAAGKQFEKCVAYEPFYAPCAENVYDALAISGRDKEAHERFRSTLDKGLVTYQYVNFPALARFNEKSLFMFATNQPWMLPGWRRHEELYEAHKNLGGDHRQLIEDVRQFAATNKDTNSLLLGTLLMPIGDFGATPWGYVIWDAGYKNYRQSPQFNKYIKASGVYDYWREYGFPPQCRPVGDDNFECD